MPWGLLTQKLRCFDFNVLQGVDIDDPGQKSMDDCCEELFDHDYVKEL
jgi:hypothetical protein